MCLGNLLAFMKLEFWLGNSVGVAVLGVNEGALAIGLLDGIMDGTFYFMKKKIKTTEKKEVKGFRNSCVAKKTSKNKKVLAKKS